MTTSASSHPSLSSLAQPCRERGDCAVPCMGVDLSITLPCCAMLRAGMNQGEQVGDTRLVSGAVCVSQGGDCFNTASLALLQQHCRGMCETEQWT